ncbi:hypothetical protein VNO78_12449 [Psophocarpus tetragonolobus]|uniref:Uncharacterized protein n=1 Tax=Psophocarpus tetragonolobus TaxID=3891 RepID=A0AAN9SP53_PSOTE
MINRSTVVTTAVLSPSPLLHHLSDETHINGDAGDIAEDEMREHWTWRLTVKMKLLRDLSHNLSEDVIQFGYGFESVHAVQGKEVVVDGRLLAFDQLIGETEEEKVIGG